MTESFAESMLAVRQDQGPFYKLGGQFKVNKADWIGAVVISSTGVYLLKKAQASRGYGGGLAGALLSQALQREDNVSTCTAEDLPPQIRAQLDPKNKLGKNAVVVIPRATVSYATCGTWSNRLKLEVGADRFAIATPTMQIFSAPRKITALGWQLKVRLTPASAPVHSLAPPTAGGKPLWARVLMIVGAIALVILVIVIRVALQMKGRP